MIVLQYTQYSSILSATCEHLSPMCRDLIILALFRHYLYYMSLLILIWSIRALQPRRLIHQCDATSRSTLVSIFAKSIYVRISFFANHLFMVLIAEFCMNPMHWVWTTCVIFRDSLSKLIFRVSSFLTWRLGISTICKSCQIGRYDW